MSLEVDVGLGLSLHRVTWTHRLGKFIGWSSTCPEGPFTARSGSAIHRRHLKTLSDCWIIYIYIYIIPNDLKTQKTCEPWMHNCPLGPTAKHLAQVRAKVGSGPQSILQAEVESYTEAVLKIAKDGTTQNPHIKPAIFGISSVSSSKPHLQHGKWDQPFYV